MDTTTFYLICFSVVIGLFLLLCWFDKSTQSKSYKYQEVTKIENEEKRLQRKKEYYKKYKVSDDDLIVHVKSFNKIRCNTRLYFIQRHGDILRIVTHGIYARDVDDFKYNINTIKSLIKYGDDNFVLKKSQEVHYFKTFNYCGGHPNIAQDCNCLITIENRVITLEFKEHTKLTVAKNLYYEYFDVSSIISIEAKTKQQIYNDITLGRVILFGPLAIAMKKRKVINKYYIVINYKFGKRENITSLVIEHDSNYSIQDDLNQLKYNVEIAKRYKKYYDTRKFLLITEDNEIEMEYEDYKVFKKLVPNIPMIEKVNI